MPDSPDAEEIFDAALRLQICIRRNLEVKFFSDQVRVSLPPKRALAETCSLPVSRITAILADMERDQLIAAEHRGGMWATPAGNRIIAGLLAQKYRREAEELLGQVVLAVLLGRL